MNDTRAVEVKHEMLAGGLGGFVSRFLVAPLDQVKIKKQVDIHGESSLSILRGVIRSQGVLRGLWKGADFTRAGG